MARSLSSLPVHLSLTVIVLLHSLEGALADFVPYLNPGFEFNYNKPNQPLALPISSQCEQIHLTWARTANETGPSPVAPYSMQVYSSASSVPYVVNAGFGPSFDWNVPFLPGTQYQTCMYDANGESGGCQALYTTIANSTNSTTPSCQFPTPPVALTVSAAVPNGAMSQFSQINQCETLSVTPQSGRPPYTLTVAPASHPPYNITSQSSKTISWRVTLPVGFKFFLLLSSADGQMWANGPMSVGGLGGDSCLVPGMIRQSLFEQVVIGASAGGLVIGFAAGLLSCLIFAKIKRKRRAPSEQFFGGARDYLSHDNLSRPLKAPPSTLGRSTSFGTRSSAPSSPTLNSFPLTQAPAVRHSDVPPMPQIPVDLPLRPQRRRSREPYTRVPENDTSPLQSEYPADIKHPFPPSDASVFSRDDTESLASSSNTHSRPARPISTHSRAPTYVPRPSHLRGAVNAIQEDDTPELPPQYGRHTEDPHLKYAPSVLSSGNRF